METSVGRTIGFVYVSSEGARIVTRPVIRLMTNRTNDSAACFYHVIDHVIKPLECWQFAFSMKTLLHCNWMLRPRDTWYETLVQIKLTIFCYFICELEKCNNLAIWPVHIKLCIKTVQWHSVVYRRIVVLWIRYQVCTMTRLVRRIRRSVDV